MKELQNLLNQVAIITKKNAEFLDATGGRFNIFRITGVDHYEETHSAILAELFNPKGTHGLKEKFLKAFCDRIVLEEQIKDFDYESAVVKTEASTDGNGRIDILIEDKNRCAIVIENKIFAKDQDTQLKRYHSFASKFYGGNFQIFYLTLDGKKASDNSGGGIKYTTISYAENIIIWLDECLNLSTRFPLVRETINQYINHIKQLTNQDMDMKNQEELLGILSRPENVVAAIKISENIAELKKKVVYNMVKDIAESYGLHYKLSSKDNFSFYFYQNGWEDGAGIWFGEAERKTYYSIKTADSVLGKAELKYKITELFELDPTPWNPFGLSIVHSNNWKWNVELYSQMANGSFARESIVTYLEKALEYISENENLEKELKGESS